MNVKLNDFQDSKRATKDVIKIARITFIILKDAATINPIKVFT